MKKLWPLGGSCSSWSESSPGAHDTYQNFTACTPAPAFLIICISKHYYTSTYACSRAVWLWVIAVHQNITVPRHMPVPGHLDASDRSTSNITVPWHMPVPGPCGWEWSRYIKTLLYLDICLFQGRVDVSDRSTQKHYCTSTYACSRAVWMWVIAVHQNITVPRHMLVPGPFGYEWSQYIKTLLYLDICLFQGHLDVCDSSTPKHYCTLTYACSRTVWISVIAVHQNITVPRYMPVPGSFGCVW